jgi:hypothetical protein
MAGAFQRNEISDTALDFPAAARSPKKERSMPACRGVARQRLKQASSPFAAAVIDGIIGRIQPLAPLSLVTTRTKFASDCLHGVHRVWVCKLGSA